MSLKWHLSYTVGYMQLGMYQDAEREIQSIPEVHKNHPDVLALAVELYHSTHEWTKLLETSRNLIDANPENPGGWVSCAYATRRIEGIEQARELLLEAHEKHPEEPIILFNLGCYAAQCGALDTAEAYVRRAINLDPSFRKVAQEDEDLEPLRATGLNFS